MDFTRLESVSVCVCGLVGRGSLEGVEGVGVCEWVEIRQRGGV